MDFPSISSPLSYSRVSGLVGKNNAGAPDTKYDLTSADAVILYNPTVGAVEKLVTSPATITIDTAVQGRNGRDQAGAFGATTWLHFYHTWDGATLAGRVSTAAPPTGPTLANGETSWAYDGTVYFDGSSHLLRTRMLGAWGFYEAQHNVLSAGVATTETAVDLSPFVPPTALAIKLHALLKVTAGSNIGDILPLRVVTGVDYFTLIRTTGNNVGDGSQTQVDVPNIGRQVLYLTTAGPGPSLTLDVMGYRVANGDV